MSWASGSSIMSDIISELKDKIWEDDTRQEVYSVLIEVFRDNDCDTLNECFGEDPAFDMAYDEIFPDEDEDDDLDDYFEDEDELNEDD